jgi:DNA-binding LacI/PurR family transcriptional regulator
MSLLVVREVPERSGMSTSVTGDTSGAQEVKHDLYVSAPAYDGWVNSPKRVTILDLARDLGLAKTTVSDALQGKGRVAPETVALVRARAEELGYVLNRAARSLRSRSTGALGLYIPPVVRNFSFYMEFAFGAAEASARAGADLVLIARDHSAMVEQPSAVGGLLVIDPLAGDPTIQHFVATGTDMVSVGRLPEASLPHHLGVIEADHGGLSRTVFDRVFARGARRPAFLGSDGSFFSSWAEDLESSYLSWCSERGLEPLADTVSVEADSLALAAKVNALLAAGADAIITGPQGFAARVLPLVRAAGHDPRTFPLASLVGDPSTELNDERIISVDLRPRAFGEESIRLLVERLGASGPPVHRTHTGRVLHAVPADTPGRGGD